MVVYTRKGDKGDTTLGSGMHAEKTSLRIAALGDADELNSCIGFCRCFCSAESSKILERVQHDLFRLQAEISEGNAGYKPVGKEDVELLEKTIDSIDSKLPPLSKFILPAGSEAASALHVARAVCRRAERTMFSLHSEKHLGEASLAYVNRLSTLLFVLARHENAQKGREEKNPDYSGNI